MTVAELKKALDRFPDDTPVVIPYYRDSEFQRTDRVYLVDCYYDGSTYRRLVEDDEELVEDDDEPTEVLVVE